MFYLCYVAIVIYYGIHTLHIKDHMTNQWSNHVTIVGYFLVIIIFMRCCSHAVLAMALCRCVCHKLVLYGNVSAVTNEL